MKKIFLTLCLSCLLISTMFVSTYATTMNVADNYLETDNYILKRENSSEKTIVYVKGKDGAMVWECDNPPVGIEQEESYIFGTMIILRIKGVAAGRYQVDMKWYNPLNPGQPPLGRQTIEVIVQPWP